mmetsp:Transcript_18218/g.44738  ORF Transcript_18218/g.44738 Transcript_18218/m.44738 type:complete len:211 (+) Transcript_18218:2023-2655(+)
MRSAASREGRGRPLELDAVVGDAQQCDREGRPGLHCPRGVLHCGAERALPYPIGGPYPESVRVARLQVPHLEARQGALVEVHEMRPVVHLQHVLLDRSAIVLRRRPPRDPDALPRLLQNRGLRHPRGGSLREKRNVRAHLPEPLGVARLHAHGVCTPGAQAAEGRKGLYGVGHLVLHLLVALGNTHTVHPVPCDWAPAVLEGRRPRYVRF